MKQSLRVPCPPFDVTLSHWDRIFPPTHSKRVLCFALSDSADKHRIVDWLYIALHHTVQQAPFLAGTIVPFADERVNRPWLRDIAASGAARLDVDDLSHELSYTDLERSGFPQDLLKAEKLCSLHQVAYVTEEPVDVCCVNANFIAGGLLLVFSIIHIATDGHGVIDVLRIFADAFCRAQSGELSFPLTQRTERYKVDRRTQVNGAENPGPIERHSAYATSPINTNAFIRDTENSSNVFRMRSTQIEALKKAASTGLPVGQWISTGDAIAALIWRSIMLARHRAGRLTADATSGRTQPIDFRSHLRLETPYFGNAIYMAKSSLPLKSLADPVNGLSIAARMIRNEVKGLTADTVRDLVGFSQRNELNEQTCLSAVREVTTSGIILTSHFKFDTHGIDFGPAVVGRRIQALRFPARGTMLGATIVMPKLPDGGCEFTMVEFGDTIAYLKQDETFLQYATSISDTPAPPASAPVFKENEVASLGSRINGAKLSAKKLEAVEVEFDKVEAATAA